MKSNSVFLAEELSCKFYNIESNYFSKIIPKLDFIKLKKRLLKRNKFFSKKLKLFLNRQLRANRNGEIRYHFDMGKYKDFHIYGQIK